MRHLPALPLERRKGWGTTGVLWTVAHRIKSLRFLRYQSSSAHAIFSHTPTTVLWKFLHLKAGDSSNFVSVQWSVSVQSSDYCDVVTLTEVGTQCWYPTEQSDCITHLCWGLESLSWAALRSHANNNEFNCRVIIADSKPASVPKFLFHMVILEQQLTPLVTCIIEQVIIRLYLRLDIWFFTRVGFRHLSRDDQLLKCLLSCKTTRKKISNFQQTCQCRNYLAGHISLTILKVLKPILKHWKLQVRVMVKKIHGSQLVSGSIWA